MRPLLAALLLLACAREPALAPASAAPADPASPAPAPEPAPVVPEPEPPAENDPRWHPALRAIVASYSQWGRVDDEMRWAPHLCRLPTPARARISASTDEGSHGRKLYTLYAMDPVAYGARPSMTMLLGSEPPVLADLSQVLVKEAFTPVETELTHGLDLRPAEHDGKRYLPGERQGLYVLFKPREDDPAATDAGWVYGTIAADMTTITGAGRMAGCMGCHRSQPGRLYGLQRSAPH